MMPVYDECGPDQSSPQAAILLPPTSPASLNHDPEHTGHDAYQVAFVGAGCITAIVAAMQTHAKDLWVNLYACEALRSIAGHDANQVAFVGAGGIDAIVAAMRTHPNDAGLNRCACEALRSIAGNVVDVAHTASESMLQFLPSFSPS